MCRLVIALGSYPSRSNPGVSSILTIGTNKRPIKLGGSFLIPYICLIIYKHMKKVSFDYDNTLDRKDVQEYATKLVGMGIEVWVVTSRFDTETALNNRWWWIEESNLKLIKEAENCGISKDNIIFTCMEDKSNFLKGKGFIFHLDDDEVELESIIESGDNCIGINVDDIDWLIQCENKIK